MKHILLIILLTLGVLAQKVMVPYIENQSTNIDNMTVSKNSSYLLTSYFGNSVIWDINNGKKLYSYDGHETIFISSSEQYFFIVQNNLIIKKDITTGLTLERVNIHSQRSDLKYFGISPDDRFIYASSLASGNNILCFELHSGKLVEEYQGATNPPFLTINKLSSDGKKLLQIVNYALDRQTVHSKKYVAFSFFSTDNDKPYTSLVIQDRTVYEVQLTWDGKYIVTREQETIKNGKTYLVVRDMLTGAEINKINSNLTNFQISQNNKYIFGKTEILKSEHSNVYKQRFAVLNFDLTLNTIIESSKIADRVTWLNDNKSLIVAGRDKLSKMDLNGKKTFLQESGVNRLVSYVYSPKHQKVYASYIDGSLNMINLKNNQITPLKNHKALFSLSLSADESKLIAGIKDGGIALFDLNNDHSVKEFGFNIWVNNIQFSRDDKYIIALQISENNSKKRIVIWDINNSITPKYSIDSNSSIERFGTNKDNQLLVLLSDENNRSNQQVNFYNLDTGAYQRSSSVLCSFEKMIDSYTYPLINDLTECDNLFSATLLLKAMGYSQQAIVSFTTASMTKPAVKIYQDLFRIKDIEMIDHNHLLAQNYNGFLELIDISTKKSVKFYFFLDNSWLTLNSDGYFKASSENTIANLSIKIDENSMRALTNDEIKYYHRPEIIDNQLKTSITVENK